MFESLIFNATCGTPRPTELDNYQPGLEPGLRVDQLRLQVLYSNNFYPPDI